jgi:hypothetical protein
MVKPIIRLMKDASSTVLNEVGHKAPFGRSNRTEGMKLKSRAIHPHGHGITGFLEVHNAFTKVGIGFKGAPRGRR